MENQQQKVAKTHMKKPENENVQISTKKPLKHFIFITKIYMKYYETVELNALGEATANAVQTAAQLERDGVAVIKSIKTIAHENTQDNADKQQTRTKQKLVIQLSRGKNFEEATKDIIINEQ